MKEAVAYYRVSTTRQGMSGLGLAAQKSSVHLYSKQNKISLIKEFREVESGKRKNRPVLQEALEYCKSKNAILLIAKLNRLGRDLPLVSALLEGKIQIVSVQYPSANKFLLQIIAAFDQNEAEEISQNTIAALKAAKKRGVKLGKYGKTLAKKNKVAAKDFAKKTIPKILKLRENGFKTIQSLVDELNRKKIYPFHGKKYKWHPSTVYKILHSRY